MTAHEDLLKLLQSLCTLRSRFRYVIDGLSNHESWYIWFDVEMDEDNPKPGTCDIHIQTCGTATDAYDSGFRVVKDANRYGVLRFLGAIGVNHLPEKARKAYYQLGVMNPLRSEPQQ